MKYKKINNIKKITKDSSFNKKGLQFADNVVGVIRKHLSNADEDDFYGIIKIKLEMGKHDESVND